MPDFKWKPIEPLSEEDRAIDLADIRPLYESWRSAKERLAKSSSDNLKKFNDRLVRRLSVETGILERIYDIDRGTTNALVTNGFVENLVAHGSTNLEPSRLIDILRDQEAAIELVIDCVARNRELTIGLVHELHSILTKHQDTTSALDPNGNRCEIKLVKGEFKSQPNNPLRPDGTSHEYCPPVHVASEMDSLLGMLKTYSDEDPIILASWFHHRFTQIHPYQDGNGRVGRTLAAVVLLRANLLPLVVDRDLRTEYLVALEKADSGDLTNLAVMFARLERGAILEALSVDADTEIEEDKNLSSAVISSIAAKFDKRRAEKDIELRKVNDAAAQIRRLANESIKETFHGLMKSVIFDSKPGYTVVNGGPDLDNAHWYKHDVINTGYESGKFVNFDLGHYFVKAIFNLSKERLVFVCSMHHVGHELAGIMEATAFARVELFEDPEDRRVVSEEFFRCSLEPFVFTYRTDVTQIEESFSRWLDTTVAIAIKEFGDRL